MCHVSEGGGGGGARQGEEGVHAYIHACMRIWVKMENCICPAHVCPWCIDGDGKDGFGGRWGGGGAIRHAPIITKLLFCYSRSSPSPYPHGISCALQQHHFANCAGPVSYTRPSWTVCSAHASNISSHPGRDESTARWTAKQRDKRLARKYLHAYG